MQHSKQPRPGDPHQTDGTTRLDGTHVGNRIAPPGRQRAHTVLATQAAPPTTLPGNRRREMARSSAKGTSQGDLPAALKTGQTNSGREEERRAPHAAGAGRSGLGELGGPRGGVN